MSDEPIRLRRKSRGSFGFDKRYGLEWYCSDHKGDADDWGGDMAKDDRSLRYYLRMKHRRRLGNSQRRMTRAMRRLLFRRGCRHIT